MTASLAPPFLPSQQLMRRLFTKQLSLLLFHRCKYLGGGGGRGGLPKSQAEILLLLRFLRCRDKLV